MSWPTASKLDGASALAALPDPSSQFNVVLLVPDDLPAGVQRQSGDLTEMRALFEVRQATPLRS